MDEIKIPKATARRLPLYYRYLIFLNDEGKEKVSSTELAEAVQVDSASIRRDFSYFGALGKRGYGYDVKNLLNFFKKILNQDTLTNVALVGVGNMGHALLNYNFKRTNNIRISAAFDINPEITGTIMSGVPVYDMSEMKKQLREQQITIAILCVPQTAAQKTANEMFDAGIAILAGFMIIPAVFAFSGGDPTVLNKGPGLMFVTVPKVFETMAFGNVMGGVFFLLVLFAALTSSISLMEAVVATVCDQFKWERKKGVLIVTVLAILIGIPSSLGQGVWSQVLIFGFNFLDFFDFITNSVLMPVGAFFTCILVGHVLETKIITDEVKLSSPFKREKLFIIMVKYIAPLCIVAILISSILEALGVIKY